MDFEKLLKKSGVKTFKEHLAENTRPEIQKIIDEGKEISLAEYRDMRLNSFERHQLYPLLSDEALLWLIEVYYSNIPVLYGKLPGTYIEGLVHSVLPIIIERYKSLKDKLENKDEA